MDSAFLRLDGQTYPFANGRGYLNNLIRTRRNPSDLSPVSQKGSSTQWGRALRELGITQILAHSPEAKGRVERANGTFQDRLVAELRLAGACTLAEANRVLTEFLTRFNQRFGVLPPSRSRPTGQWIRSWTWVVYFVSRSCAECCRAIPRTVSATLHYGATQLCWSPCEVQERLDGRLLVRHREQILTPQEAPPLATELRDRISTGPVASASEPDPTGWVPATTSQNPGDSSHR